MLQVKTAGFILDKAPGYGDEGKITIFTKDFGILHVVASGLYRPGARLSAWTEPPNQVMADLSIPEGSFRNGRLLTLSPRNIYSDLRRSYKNTSWYFFYLFLLMHFLPQGIKSPFLYDLWQELINSQTFRDQKHRNLGFIYFSTKFLKNQGFYPSFKFCLHCRKNWETDETAYFFLHEQGLVCHNCLKENSGDYQNNHENYSLSLDFLNLLPLKNKIFLLAEVLRVRSAERIILEIAEKSGSLEDFFAKIFSRSKINDLSIKKARNFLLIFLAPLL